MNNTYQLVSEISNKRIYLALAKRRISDFKKNLPSIPGKAKIALKNALLKPGIDRAWKNAPEGYKKYNSWWDMAKAKGWTFKPGEFERITG